MSLRSCSFVLTATFLWSMPPVSGQVISPSNTAFAESQQGHWLIGKPWNQKFTGTPGCKPLQYSPTSTAPIAQGMPSDFTWAGDGTNGELSGTFTAAGVYEFNLRLDCGQTGLLQYFMVRAYPPLTMVKGPDLPPCHIGTACQVPLTEGGAPVFHGTVTSGSLPPGCRLYDDGYNNHLIYGGALMDYRRRESVLCSPPAAQGTYSFEVSVTDGHGTRGTGSYTMTFGAAGEFYTSPSALSFAAVKGSTSQSRPLAVGTSDLTKVKFSVSSDASWLTVSATSASAPTSLTVTMDPSKLAAGQHEGHLNLVPEGYKQPVRVIVRVLVAEAGTTQSSALIGVAPESAEVDLWSLLDGVKTYDIGFHAWNAGTGTLSAQVLAHSQANWLSVRPSQVTLAEGQAQALTVTVDASQLKPGTYPGSVEVKAGTQVKTVPVTVVVPKANYKPSIRLEADRYPTTCGIGSGDGICHQIYVYNDVYPTALDFTATVRGLHEAGVLSPSEGHIAAHPNDPWIRPFTMMFGVPTKTANSWSTGRHEGLVEVKAAGATGSPALAKLTMTLVNVLKNGNRFTLDEGSFEFRVQNPVQVHYPGQSVAASLQIVNSSNVPVSFSVSSPSTAVSFDVASAVVQPGRTTTVEAKVDPDPKNLKWPKILAHLESLAGAAVYELQAEMVAGANHPSTPGRVSGEAAFAEPQAAACQATRLVMGTTEPPTHFRRVADLRQPIGATVYDDCGSIVKDAVVTASFSNGDRALGMPLRDGVQGLYQADWFPGAASDDMAITVRAMKGTLTPASAQVFGAIVEDASPVVYNGGMVENVNPVVGVPSSPGSIIAIYGRNLAAGMAQAETVPLPRSLGGITVSIGGIQAPLFFVSPGQINAQVPVELAADAPYSVVVETATSFSTPKTLRLAKLSPGVLTYADGRAIAQHLDFSLVNAASPAKPGEYVVFYLTGMGPTSPAVASGTSAPASPLASLTSSPTVTVGGTNADVKFAGLTPGGVGLYQINLQVPASSTAGDLPVIVTQDGVAANTVMLPVGR